MAVRPPSPVGGGQVIQLPGIRPGDATGRTEPFKRLFEDLQALGRIRTGRGGGAPRLTLYDTLPSAGKVAIRGVLGDVPRGNPIIDGARHLVRAKS